MNQHTTIEMPAQRRAAEVRASSFNEAANTIEIVWSTGARVRRNSWWDGPYDEELDMSSKSVRLERLNNGAPLLAVHDSFDLRSVLGSIVPGSARVAGGKGTATVKLSNAADVADAVQKIREGDVRSISVGYRIHKVEKTEGQEGDVPLHRVVDWEPLEVSAVPIPADPGAHVRAEGQQTNPVIIINRSAKEGIQMPKTNTIPASEDADIAELERIRCSTISDLATRSGVADMIAPAIRDNTSIADFRRSVINRLAADDEARGGFNVQVSPYAEARGVSDLDQRRAKAMEDALLHRVDPRQFPMDAGAAAYASFPLLELARASIEARGTRTGTMNKMAIAGEALAQRSGGLHSTSDFPTILGNVVNRTLRAAYDAAPQTWRPFTSITSVPDFREVSRVQLGDAPQFEKVNEHGEFKRGTMGEAGERYKVETFGRVIGVTRQVLINDDLGAFTRLPKAFGIQAANLESDIVWAQILANPTMGDNVALFDNAHKNLLTAGAIGETTVSEARLKMGLQTGLDGKTVLNLTPAFLVVPKALQTAAEKFVATLHPTKETDAASQQLKQLQIIAEPRLDAGIGRYGIAGDDGAYFFVATPATIDTVELAYLQGAEGVYVETRQGFDVDGLEVKVRLDIGAKVLDFRGLSKNAGS